MFLSTVSEAKTRRLLVRTRQIEPGRVSRRVNHCQAFVLKENLVFVFENLYVVERVSETL